MLKKIFSFIKTVKRLIFLGIILLIAFTVFSYFKIQAKSKLVYKIDSPKLEKISKNIDVGIVFGGGGVGGTHPLPLTKERLDTAKKLLDRGFVKTLVLSGDNRFLNYNEPTVMYNYLVAQGVDKNSLQQDFAGRSTYETCERANKIFNIKKAILISESTHLPRAIYLCNNFGIESYGVESDGAIAATLRVPQELREVMARDKAVFNVYVIGERTVLGKKIDLNLQLK